MELFSTLIEKSYSFSKEIYDTDLRWKLLRVLYNDNYLIDDGSRSYSTLPKKIHQIWLGSEIPDVYKKLSESWIKFNLDWEYTLWTDKNIDCIEIQNRDIFNSIKNMGQKSDFLRYHILNQYGGLYVDTDFECLKSFDPLSYLNFFTGIGYPSTIELYIGLIACIPNHPIIQHILGSMKNVSGNHYKAIFNSTGSYFFTRNFFRVVQIYVKGIVAFPMDYFYPYPNNIRGMYDPYKYVQPCSYALHHWAVSWSNKEK
jgi:mannosyltransferase OCH1-like enzyme